MYLSSQFNNTSHVELPSAYQINFNDHWALWYAATKNCRPKTSSIILSCSIWRCHSQSDYNPTKYNELTDRLKFYGDHGINNLSQHLKLMALDLFVCDSKDFIMQWQCCTHKSSFFMIDVHNILWKRSITGTYTAGLHTMPFSLEVSCLLPSHFHNLFSCLCSLFWFLHRYNFHFELNN